MGEVASFGTCPSYFYSIQSSPTVSRSRRISGALLDAPELQDVVTWKAAEGMMAVVSGTRDQWQFRNGPGTHSLITEHLGRTLPFDPGKQLMVTRSNGRFQRLVQEYLLPSVMPRYCLHKLGTGREALTDDGTCSGTATSQLMDGLHDRYTHPCSIPSFGIGIVCLFLCLFLPDFSVPYLAILF